MTPVSTWSKKAARVALPNTYHHFASAGTWCFMIGPRALRTPRRSSSQRPSMRRRARMALDRSAAGRPALALRRLARAPDSARGHGRRARRDRPVLVVDAAVAGAHEEVGARHPPDGAPEVRAVHGERDELVLAGAAQPRGGVRGDPRPGQGRRVDEAHVRGLADLEVGELADRAPDDRRRLQERREDEPRRRHHEARAPRARPDAHPREEAPPLRRHRRGVVRQIDFFTLRHAESPRPRRAMRRRPARRP